MRYELLPGQRRFLELGTPFRAYVAGAGSGKTWCGAAFALAHMRPGTVGMVSAPSYRMLADVTSKQILDFLYEHKATFEYRKSEERLVYNNALIYFRSAEAPQRLRGVNLNWAWLDEAAICDPEAWKVILGRLRVGKQPEAWCTSTPCGFNWLYQTFAERGDPNYGFVQASARENKFLSPGFIENLESSYSGSYAKQEIDGAFTSFEGQVYDEFAREVHVCDPFPVPASWERMRGIDFGYVNEFCCLWAAVDHDKRIYIYDEHYQARQLIAQHVEAIRQHDPRDYFTVADHDAQDSAELRKYGIQTFPARKAVMQGILAVKSRLKVQPDGHPRLFIFSSCVNLIKEMMGYSWAPARLGVNDKEEPRKEKDHAADVCRYLCMELEKPRVQITDWARMLGL